MTSNKEQSDEKGGNFESSLEEIESIVDTLEQDNTSLEQSLSAFESGIKLTRLAQKALNNAEQKVQTLLEESGEPIAHEFSEVDTEL
jgi:exodeoxyribonuclease VII small subunit